MYLHYPKCFQQTQRSLLEVMVDFIFLPVTPSVKREASKQD